MPSGIWAPEEYVKLPAYDRPTMEQPMQVFLCHQHDRDSDASRVCAGWAECHDGDELLALRFAPLLGSMTGETVQATRDYVSPVPLFRSGTEAARHGLAEIEQPSLQAAVAMTKISRRRPDVLKLETR